jgi:hypothetical protein
MPRTTNHDGRCMPTDSLFFAMTPQAGRDRSAYRITQRSLKANRTPKHARCDISPCPEPQTMMAIAFPRILADDSARPQSSKILKAGDIGESALQSPKIVKAGEIGESALPSPSFPSQSLALANTHFIFMSLGRVALQTNQRGSHESARLSTSRSARPQSSKIIEAGDIGECTSRPFRALRIPVISRDTSRTRRERWQ